MLKTRLLLAKPSFDGHTRPINVLVPKFKELGVEVIFPGLFNPLVRLAKIALEEDVDVVGISIHTGDQISILKELRRLLDELGLKSLPIVAGGRPLETGADETELKNLGIPYFTFGTQGEDIVAALPKREGRYISNSDLDALKQGDRLSLARLLSSLQERNGLTKNFSQQCQKIKTKADVIGIASSAGRAGKSTLINALLKRFRQEKKKVAVLASDPVGWRYQGVWLSDRMAMREVAGDEGVFIRSFSSENCPLGVAEVTFEAIPILKAAGFDYIVIETIGGGQEGSRIKENIDLLVVVLTPLEVDRAGLLKAGIHEEADIVVLSRTDEVKNPKRARIDLETYFQTFRRGEEIPIIETALLTEPFISFQGLDELFHAIKSRLNERQN